MALYGKLIPENEKIVTDDEEWTDEEWATICKLFGADPTNIMQIIIPKKSVEIWGKKIRRKDDKNDC